MSVPSARGYTREYRGTVFDPGAFGDIGFIGVGLLAPLGARRLHEQARLVGCSNSPGPCANFWGKCGSSLEITWNCSASYFAKRDQIIGELFIIIYGLNH